MDFQTKLNNYAEILVRYGLNIQPGQNLTIKSETCHRDFVVIIAKHASGLGLSMYRSILEILSY